MKLSKALKFSIKGVPVLPILLMSIVTVAAVFVGTSTVTSTTVVAAGQLALFKTTTNCPTVTTAFTSDNFTAAGLVAGNPQQLYQGDIIFCFSNTGSATSYIIFNQASINSIVVSSGALPAGSSLYLAFRKPAAGWCALPVTAASANSISITTANAMTLQNTCTPPAGSPSNYLTIAGGSTVDMLVLALYYSASAPVTGTSSWSTKISAYSSSTG